MTTFELQNESETLALGERLAKLAQPGDIFILTGDLGAGKTTFSKGFAKGLQIEQLIKSPTYTLIKEYTTGTLPLYHMDVYRLENGENDLGLDDYLYGEGVCLIEWGKNIETSLDEGFLELILDKTGENSRRLTVSHHSKEARFKALIQQLEGDSN